MRKKFSIGNLSLPTYLALAATLGLIYLAVAAWGFGVVGFPLDDAWIHQTYARNLARSGQLAFVPGVPSAGSTAPLWSLLLAVGYLLRVPFFIWSYGLGLLLLGLTGWTTKRLGEALFPDSPRVGLWAGLFCVLEWHHVWAALSGMETLLFVWLSLFLVERSLAWLTAERPPPRFGYFSLGILGGLLILTRPEGVGLVGLIGLYLAYQIWRQDAGRAMLTVLLKHWGAMSAGVALLVVPYLIFHLWATGLPFPNTFYAKQAEYGIILERFSLAERLFGGLGPVQESVQGVFRVIFIGPQLLLLPGLIFAAWLTLRERRTNLGPIWVWWLSFLLLYALRLPVTYQHGRYQIPALAWLILVGVWGTNRLMGQPVASAGGQAALRIVGRTLALSLMVLLVGFTFLGGQAYGRDVAVINGEMVTVAQWLDAHTEPETLIAAHDIGAIGYFAERPLIDLAGLVTPEVIPIIRDEAALLKFMQVHGARYMVTFPSWYPALTQNPVLILRFQTDSPVTRAAGGDNMAVYEVEPLTKP